MDPQYSSVDTNSLESVGKGKKMKPKKDPNAWMEDGDSAHWVAVKRKTKKVSVANAGRTAKYTGKRKTSKRVVSK